MSLSSQVFLVRGEYGILNVMIKPMINVCVSAKEYFADRRLELIKTKSLHLPKW